MIDVNRWFSGLTGVPDQEDDPVQKTLRLLNPAASAAQPSADPGQGGDDIPTDPRRFIPTPNIVPLGRAMSGTDTLEDTNNGSTRGQRRDLGTLNGPINVDMAPVPGYVPPGAPNRAVPGAVDEVSYPPVPSTEPYGPTDPSERNRAVRAPDEASWETGGPASKGTWDGPYPNQMNDRVMYKAQLTDDYDPRDADQGAHEWRPSVAPTAATTEPPSTGAVPPAAVEPSSVSDPSRVNVPDGFRPPEKPPYVRAGTIDTGPPLAGDDPGTQAARPRPDNDNERILDMSIPSPPGWAAIVDGAGQVVDWVRHAAQGVADQVAETAQRTGDYLSERPYAGLPPVQANPGEPDYQTQTTRQQAAEQRAQEQQQKPWTQALMDDLTGIASAVTGQNETTRQGGQMLRESVRAAGEPVKDALSSAASAVEDATGSPTGSLSQAAQDVSNVLGPAAPVVAAVVRQGAVTGPRQFANAADALQAARAAIGTPNPRGPLAGTDRLEGIRRWIVRNASDNRVDLNELQKEAQRLLGRPLEADEMLSELTRANPSGSAKVLIDSAIKPAVQPVEQAGQRENLSTLMGLLNNEAVATATGNPGRAFSGGLTAADSQAAAQHLWSTLTPEQQTLLDQSSGALYRVVDHYRDEMVRAGVWTPALAADLKAKYPTWVPTKILDYMNDPAAVSTGSRGISLRDRGLRQYTADGTAKAREDPIASIVRYVQDSEAIIQKNEAFNAFVNLRDRVPGWDQMIREVSSSTPAAVGRGEKTVTGFVNGERKTFIVPSPMAGAIQMEQGQQVPILRQMTQLFKEFITRTPMFVAGQVPLDAFGYTIRETAREGGPLAAPKVAAELAKGYAEAFHGLLSGEFKGDAARFLREGGGMAGFYERSADAASKTVDDMTRRNMFEVRNSDDAKKLAGWLLGGGWVQAVGSRVEMAPRVASFRLGERRALRSGASKEKAALEGMIGARDVTLDFQRGGAAAKVLNQIVPFFNVGLQSAVTLPRMLKENPTGAVTTMLSLVAAPTLAAEMWNRADPQREQDYQDVPDYVKDRGIVIMLPGAEGRDERGERRPNYALIPLRELAPVAILSRDLAQQAIGKGQRGWSDTAKAVLGAASPVQASGAADLFSSTLPPVASTGLQLAADSDFFRGGPIATDRRDENASALATGIAGTTGYRPSQVDFSIRDLFGGVGAMASAASDLATGKKKDEDRIQNAPVVGGMLSRFVGDAVGGNLTRAQQSMQTRDVQTVLRDVGLRNDQLVPLDSKGPNDFPFTRREQAQAQQLMNQHLTEPGGLASLPTSIPNWSSLPQSAKQNIVREAAAAARKRAEGEVLSGIPEADRQRRFDAVAKKKAS